STEALELKEVPKNLIVIGGGVIGLELGSVYARLGAKVSVIEYANSIISTMDAGLGKELQRTLKKELGMEFFVGDKAKNANTKMKKMNVKGENKKVKEVTLESYYFIVTVRRCD